MHNPSNTLPRPKIRRAKRYAHSRLPYTIATAHSSNTAPDLYGRSASPARGCGSTGDGRAADGGQQSVALQLIDQSPISFDDVVLQDLTAAQAVNVDQQVSTEAAPAGSCSVSACGRASPASRSAR